MDEVIKIYQPREWKTVNNPKPKEKTGPVTPAHPKSKWKSREETIRQVIDEHEKKIEEMRFRHPWFDIVFNYVVAVVIVALFAAFCIWGVQIQIVRKAEELTASEVSELKAAQEAEKQAKETEEEALKNTETKLIKQMGNIAAKALYGIRNFDEKYHYTSQDFKTYVRCMCDRADLLIEARYQTTKDKLPLEEVVSIFEEVVSEKAQFLAYSENNQVLIEYLDVSVEEITTWLHETSKPWDVRFRFAELKDDGIWLTNVFNADGYARRMRY